MLQRILDFFTSLLDRIFGRGKREDDGANDPRPAIIENRTPFPLTLIRRLDDSTHALARGEILNLEIYPDERWGLIETTTSIEVGRFSVGAHDLPEDEPIRVYLDDDMIEVPPVEPGLPEHVTARFRNRTPFDLRIDDEDGESVDCPAGHSVLIDSPPRHTFRAVTKGRPASAGNPSSGAVATSEVPPGLQLGRYLVGDEDLTHDIENTLIGFENASFLFVDCCRRRADGTEQREATLMPKQYTLLENTFADEWRVRSVKALVRRVTRSWEPQHISIDTSMMERPGGAAPERPVTITNRSVLTLDVHRRDGSGRWASAVEELAPGDRQTITVAVGTELQATERRTGVAVAGLEVPAADDPSSLPPSAAPWPIHFGQHPGQESVIEVSNETHMITYLVDVTTREVVKLGRHGHHTTTSQFGNVLALCAIEPERDADQLATRVDGVIAIGVAQRVQPVIRPTSSDLRGHAGGQHVSIEVENECGLRIDVVEIDADGLERTLAEDIDADGTVACDTTTDLILRAVKHGSGEIVHEEIATVRAPRAMRVAIASSPAGPRSPHVLINRTMMNLALILLDEDGDEQMGRVYLEPGRSRTLNVQNGYSYVLREQLSNALIHAFVLQRTQPVIEVTTEHLRSATGSAARDLRIINLSGLDVVVATVDPDGSERDVRSFGTSEGDRVATIRSTEGSYYRAYAGTPRTVIAEYIPGEPSWPWQVTLGVARVAENAPSTLLEGEIAICASRQLAGRAVVLDRSVPSASVLRKLNATLGSIRVGSHADATVHYETAAGDTRALRVTMDSEVPDAAFGAQVVAVDVGRLVDADEVGIAQRSHLVDEYRAGSSPSKPNDGGTHQVKVFRTTLTVPESVSAVDLYAAAEAQTVELHHDGNVVQASDTTPARLRPNRLGKVIFGVPATSLATPTLLMRTNTMPHDTLIQIHPDAVIHEKVAALPEGAMSSTAARATLGLDVNAIDDDACHHVQQALQNLSRTVQHHHTMTPHGVDHHRRIGPENMSHPHWMLSQGTDGRPTYRPMTPDAVRQHLARPSSLDDTQASLGDLFNIIVHTARKIGTDVDGTVKHVVADVGQTAHKIAHDVERTTETVTDDIRRGDVGGALTAAARGTLSITEDAATGVLRVGGDVVAGAAHLAGDIAVGAEQLVVATIEVLGNAVTFVLDHTGAVGRAIESVLTAIGSTIDKALDWLTSLLPLDHIFHVHDAVRGAFEPSSLDRRVTSWLDPMEAATEHVFESMDDEVKRLKATSHSELHHLPTGHSALPAHHSEGKDALDWVMSHVFHPDATSTAPPAPTDAARQRADGVHATVSGHPATSGVDASVTRSMDQVVARGLTDPSAIAPMLVDIAASVAGDALGLLRDTTHEVYTFADHVASTLADAASGAMDIPVIGAIYRAHDPGGQSPSVMGIAALGAAVPLAFAHPQSEGLDFTGAFTHVDGADANAAVELPPAPSSLEIVLTSGYIAFQTLLGLVAAIPDDRPPEIDVELTETGSARRPADTSDLSIERSAAQDIETVELVWGFGLLMCSTPTAVWTGHLDHLFENGGDPLEDAPNTWGDIMFLVQFVTYLVELVAFARSKSSAPAGGGGLEFEGRSGMQLFAGLSAALQLIGTIVITVAEIIKVDKHDNVDAGSDYAKWGHTPLGGVGMKTFGNVLGTVPSFLALAQPAGTPRTPAVRVVDVGAHVAEAAVVGVRLAQHGMY